MQISYHPGAAGEVIKEVRYYDEHSTGLGIVFTQEVDAAVRRIIASPLRFTLGAHDTRRCPVARFPHRVVYRIENGVIRVYAIAHPKRKLDYWAERLG